MVKGHVCGVCGLQDHPHHQADLLMCAPSAMPVCDGGLVSLSSLAGIPAPASHKLVVVYCIAVYL